MIERLLRVEPVRLYSVGAAAVAVAAYFLPSGGWPLVLALIAAVLGTGQAARSVVTPLAKPRDRRDRPLVAAPFDRGAVSAATVCLVIIAVVAVLFAFGKLPI